MECSHHHNLILEHSHHPDTVILKADVCIDQTSIRSGRDWFNQAYAKIRHFRATEPNHRSGCGFRDDWIQAAKCCQDCTSFALSLASLCLS